MFNGNWLFFDIDGEKTEDIEEAIYVYIKNDLSEFHQTFDEEYLTAKIIKLNTLYIWNPIFDKYEEYKAEDIISKVLKQIN